MAIELSQKQMKDGWQVRRIEIKKQSKKILTAQAENKVEVRG